MNFKLRTIFFLFAYCLLPIACLSALEIGTPAGKTGGFATYEKAFYEDNASFSGANVFFSSQTLNSEVLADNTTSHFADVLLVPGNTYYYWFMSQWKIEQASPSYHTIYVSSDSPGYLVIDGITYSTSSLILSATVWHNWGGSPPKPVNLTSFWSAENDFITLEWSNPLFSGDDIFDLKYGGGYEITRSTISESEGMVFMASVTAITSQINYKDTAVISGTTYYYSVRSYDAYRPPMFSKPEVSVPQQKRKYLTISFTVDVSNLADVRSVSIAGDFTAPRWFVGRLPMVNKGGGIWQLYYSDVSIYDGAVINYKYIVNDEIYESDIPEILGGPFRRVTLKDDGSGMVVIKDNWSVWTPTSTPSNLPDFLVGFSAEPMDNAVKLLWDYDPYSTGTILGYNLFRSTVSEGDYTMIASTDVLCAATNYFIDSVQNGVTAFYRISAVYATGRESKLSDSIKAVPPDFGMSVPAYNLSPEDKFKDRSFSATFGNATGEVVISWSPALPDAVYGPPSSYVIRYATSPITDVSKFRKAKVAGVVKGRASGGSHRLATLKLGDNCPGYYFAACAVYGLWNVVSFSTSVIDVAPRLINSSTLSEISKTSRGTGDVIAPAVASVLVPQGALPKGEYLGVIKNYYELSQDTFYAEKISNANKLARADERFGYVAENEDPATSSIFAFDIYDVSRNKFFADANSDGVSDRLAIKELTIAISYDGISTPPEELRVGVLNEKNGFWRILGDIKPELDRENKLIKFKTKHLSVYGLFKKRAPALDLSDVVVYPNPFKPHDGRAETGDYSSGIKFINLTRNAKILIYNIAGELVREKDLTSDESGDCKWDVKNDDGDFVASGVYVFVVKDDTLTSGKKKFVGKVGVVR